MSSTTKTPIYNIIKGAESNCRSIVRQTYIEVINYLSGLNDQLLVNWDTIKRLDANSLVRGDTLIWPSSFEGDYADSPLYVPNLLTFRGISLHIYVTLLGNVIIRFPVVNIVENRIESWTRRQWRRDKFLHPYKPRTAVSAVELIAFRENRLPTLDEFSKQNFIYQKDAAKVFLIKIGATSSNVDILEAFEDRHKKYMKLIKLIPVSEKNTMASIYKYYIKNRAEPAFSLWKSENSTKSDSTPVNL
jgi:hypothetical protein